MRKSTILSKDYWANAASHARNLRVMVICALCVALSIILGYFYIPINESLTIRFTFLATSVAGLVGGPVAALIFGAAVDLLDYMMHPTGVFFFGYTISSMVGALIYALCYYRQRLTVVRIIFCRLAVNLVVNVFLNALWSHILYGKGYIYRMVISYIKNIALLPVEVLITVLFFSLLIPAFKETTFIPGEQRGKITWF